MTPAGLPEGRVGQSYDCIIYVLYAMKDPFLYIL